MSVLVEETCPAITQGLGIFGTSAGIDPNVTVELHLPLHIRNPIYKDYVV
jgi:hypothetical protein